MWKVVRAFKYPDNDTWTYEVLLKHPSEDEARHYYENYNPAKNEKCQLRDEENDTILMKFNKHRQ